MAFGPPLCAACGSGSGVQEHQLIPRTAGGTELPTVWLCHLCCGLVHGRRTSAHCGTPTKVAPEANAVRKVEADAFAARVAPIARELQAEGMGLERMAAELTRRGIKTRRGGKWAAQTVKNLLARGAGRGA